MTKADRYSAIDWNTWQPKDRATLLFIVEPDRILLIEKQRGLGQGKVNGPGGRLDPGETLAECAIREAREELHITAHDPQHRGILRFDFEDGYKLEAHVYTAHSYDGTPTATEEAVPLWSAHAEIPYDRMWEDDILWLPRMLDGENFSGRFAFADDAMQGHTLDFFPAGTPIENRGVDIVG